MKIQNINKQTTDAQKNAIDQVAVGFSIESNWLSGASV